MPEAEGSENPDWRRLSEACKDAPDLEPVEKEALFSFARGDQKIRIHARISSIAARLLRHPEFDCEQVAVDGEQDYAEMWLTPGNWDPELGSIRAVEGTIPVGLLKVQTRSRSANNPADVVADVGREGADG